MKQYTRLSEQERTLIEKGIREGKSIRAIARSIDRYPSTISKEISRNGGKQKYYAIKAHARVIPNRTGYSKIRTSPELESYIRSKLKEGWSPEVISGRWNMKYGDNSIAHETIYTWIYEQKDDLYLSLPRKKKKRGLKPKRSTKTKIKDRVTVHQRAEHINNRTEIGHWEGDLVFQQGNQSQNIFTAIERKSRMVMLIKNKSKQTDIVIEGLKKAQSNNPYPMVTITFDNGSEFANHRKLGIDTYFCDPGSPWQKGSIENLNGILRRSIDSKINANDVSQEMLDSIAEKLNSRPRKILGYLTPFEVINNLHKEKLQCVAI